MPQASEAKSAKVANGKHRDAKQEGQGKKTPASASVKKEKPRSPTDKDKANGAVVKKAAKAAAAKPAAPAAKPEEKKADVKPKVEAADAEAKPVRVAKPKVVYDMPGQTKPKPDEDDPLCIFYTSLLKQRPQSELASKWCVLPDVLMSMNLLKHSFATLLSSQHQLGYSSHCASMFWCVVTLTSIDS